MLYRPAPVTSSNSAPTQIDASNSKPCCWTNTPLKITPLKMMGGQRGADHVQYHQCGHDRGRDAQDEQTTAY
jgi:hypothetical protein